jgi:hypothetical protein
MFLRREQNALLDQLKRRSESIADIYFGGLRAFADETNPYRFQLAAHSFREVLSHAPRLTGGTVAFGDNMKQRLKPVRKAFMALKQSNTLAPDPTRNVTGMSDELNEELDNFFDWADKYHSENRKKVALLLSQLAGAGPALPSDVVADEISDWVNSHQFFNGVAHNTFRAERDQFLGKLYTVEDILLRRMQPRPVSDLDEIDALLKGSADAK